MEKLKWWLMKVSALLANLVLFGVLYVITIPTIHFWRPLTRQETDSLVATAEWIGFLNAQELWWLLMALADFIVALLLFIVVKTLWRRLKHRNV
ncbi:hypothetical protein [Cronobacter dublinensis]|uniref:hypothetical protein n=2 Tax=Cronobacter dublinensis TaxID=413497 RepID=UPI001F334C14|nr:hypothetical protein [Cronobacter dublinensis]